MPTSIRPRVTSTNGRARPTTGACGLDGTLDLPLVVARAEVGQNDQLVLEAIGPLDDVVQVRVAEFVDFFLAVFGAEEGHLGDQDLRLVDGGYASSPAGAFAHKADQRHPHFVAHLLAGEANIADLAPSTAWYSGFSFLRRPRRHNPTTGPCAWWGTPSPRVRETIRSPSRDACRPARRPSGPGRAVATRGAAGHVVHRLLREVNRRRLHLHHPPAGNKDRDRRQMIEVRVGDEKRRRAGEGPRAAAELKTKLQLLDPPIGLHGRASNPRSSVL